MRWLEYEAPLSRQRRASTVDGVDGNGRTRGNRKSGRKPDQENAGAEGGDRKTRGKAVVDESRRRRQKGYKGTRTTMR